MEKKKKFIQYIYAALVATAVFFVSVSHIKTANAYFTSYTTAKGGYEVSWQHTEHIEESFENWKKYVSIKNDDGSVPVFVRVKGFCGSTYSLAYQGNDWEMVGDYFYYKTSVPAGESTSQAVVSINNIPIKPEVGKQFQVTVIYESVPVEYEEDGTMKKPWEADWTKGK